MLPLHPPKQYSNPGPSPKASPNPKRIRWKRPNRRRCRWQRCPPRVACLARHRTVLAGAEPEAVEAGDKKAKLEPLARLRRRHRRQRPRPAHRRSQRFQRKRRCNQRRLPYRGRPKARLFSPSVFPVRARVPGSSATTSVRFPATCFASCFSTMRKNSAFRIWFFRICDPC